jgi:D-xylose transport system ATP-binding protein
VLVMGEGELRGDFINHELTQEMLLAAALDHGEPESVDAANAARLH